LKDKILLVINASNTEKDFAWILENKKYDVDIKNTSDGIGQLAVQGPKAELLMKKLVDVDLSALQFYWATETDMKGIPVILSRTGYTGEDGFEVYLDEQYAGDAWDMIFSAGKEFDVKPIGLGARDTLRFEMRYCLYGNDIDKTTNPLEAGLGWIVKFDKDEFIAKDVLLEIKKQGIQRKLVGFEALTKGIPRHLQEIHAGDEKVGFVTSGTFSPSLKRGIGMGYISLAHAGVGNRPKVMGKEPIEVEIIKGPFYKHGTHK
jgi:aminomethyltransferase